MPTSETMRYLRFLDAPFFFGRAAVALCRFRLVHAWRLLALAIACLSLEACATTHSYTPVYCLAHDQVLPAEPPKVHDQLTGQADKDFRIVAGSAVRLRAWGAGLQTILESCREPAH